MEAFAARWYMRQFAMRACLAYFRECPDDPAVIRFRAAMHELRDASAALRTVTCG